MPLLDLELKPINYTKFQKFWKDSQKPLEPYYASQEKFKTLSHEVQMEVEYLRKFRN